MTLPPPPPPSGSPGSSTQPGVLTCYRHPDREAGRRCTRCGKPACADCLVQATVGSHCLDCAKAARPDTRTRARYWSASQPAIVTLVIISINVAVFLYITIRAPESLTGQLTLPQVKLGLSSDFVGDGGGVRLSSGEIYVSPGGQWYRLVTSGFLHFGLIHIGFNMYLLYVLGQMLERAIGRLRFVLVYLAGLLGGSAGVLLLDGGALSGGASGAVFGLMALAFVGHWLHGTNPLTTSIGTLLVLNLFITFTFRNISVGGHIGGAVAGALCGLAVMRPRHRALPSWMSLAAPVAVGALSVVVSVLAVG